MRVLKDKTHGPYGAVEKPKEAKPAKRNTRCINTHTHTHTHTPTDRKRRKEVGGERGRLTMARLFVCQLPAVVYRASQSEYIGGEEREREREPLLTTRANLGKKERKKKSC